MEQIMERHASSDAMVVFSNPKRADKAVKRLRTALKESGRYPPPLGTLKAVFANMCGHPSYADVVGVASMGKEWAALLDHDLGNLDRLECRRRHQATVMAARLDLDPGLSRAIVDYYEPSGNGTYDLRLQSIDGDVPTLLYALPPMQRSENGSLATIPEATGFGGSDTVYSLAFHPWGLTFEMNDHLDVDVLQSITTPAGLVSLSLDIDGCRCGVSYSRIATATISEDEPRVLRPSEIESATLTFTLGSYDLGDMDEASMADAMSTLVACDILQCAIWCLTAPRPSLVGNIRLVLRAARKGWQRVVAKGVEEMILYARETETENFHMQSGKHSWEKPSKPTLACNRLMRQIGELEIEYV
jgi:hypothetical protein